MQKIQLLSLYSFGIVSKCLPVMTHPSDTTISTGIQHRRPREGERTRGAVDALQTKIAVGLQNLDPLQYMEQLQANLDDLPEATGADSAFLALISEDGAEIETVLSVCDGFAQCSPGVLQGEKLADWPWLCKRLGHLRVIEVADTVKGPKSASFSTYGSVALVSAKVDVRPTAPGILATP